MNQLEDRLTDLLIHTANAVDPQAHADVNRVLDRASEATEEPTHLTRQTRPSRRRAVVLVGAAAAVTLLGAAAVTLGRSGDDTVRTEGPTAPADRSGRAGEGVTNPVPQLLVGADEWRLVEIETQASHAEVDFNHDDGRTLTLSLYPAEEYDSLLEERRTEHRDRGTVEIAGHEAEIVEADNADGVTAYALWADDDHAFELRGDAFVSLQDYLAVVTTIAEVDEAEWLAALPDDVVAPNEQPATIDAALAGVPLPDDLDEADVVSRVDQSLGTENYLRITVVDVVVCGWIQQWVDADARGDVAAREAATSALASSSRWPVMQELGSEFTGFIQEVADAMAADVPLDDYPSVSQGDTYLESLECPN